ncbi:hypothetical protein ACFE04_027235 [Oxalis oulophora]
MSVVEMEVFSNIQLVIITILMFLGGEVFTSMLGFMLSNFLSKRRHFEKDRVIDSGNWVENQEKPNTSTITNLETLERKSIKFLSYVVLGYLLVVHIVGSSLIFIYINLIHSAKTILKTKNISIQTFSIFLTVSTFTNCGFVPTNENMIVFKKNSGLLLLLIPQILLGNTLYAPTLRFIIWLFKKITRKSEFSYILDNRNYLGYDHLHPGTYCWFLVITVMGFIFLQFAAFCSLEWNSEALSGLSSYQKIIGSLFQVVNSRHTGESIVDLSLMTPAILVLFAVMMYLPPGTSFLPVRYQEIETSESSSKKKKKKNISIMENLTFSQLSYLTIFITLICITEKTSLKEDPLNFNVLNITLEVISAYGNVGFSTGYSCARQLKHDSSCVDTYAGFVSRWSTEGKVLLILVMFFGRLKKFSININGGKAWLLS